MDINAANRTMNAPATGVVEVPVAKAAETRSIVQAVKAVNRMEMFGKDNLLMFQRDPESKRMVIQIVNQQTHEVISQIPSEYLLRLAEDLKSQEARTSPAETV